MNARAAATPAIEKVPAPKSFAGRRLLFVLNEAYFLLTHRLELARAARQAGFEGMKGIAGGGLLNLGQQRF